MNDRTRRRIRTAIVAGAIMGGSIAAAVPAVAATATPSCRSTDLTISLGQVDAGAGQRYATLDFTNRGEDGCVLRNDLTGLTFTEPGPEGGARTIPATVTRASGSTDETVVIAPGSAGHLDLHWSVVTTPAVPDSLFFELPDDGGRGALPWHVAVGSEHRIDLGHLHL
ncbi:DUF4232 domain-containing protein [Actinoallomurus spadix]|uniref:DUF4232 domain-containing protein n=1 Tax=Actinoallomurus spadix TaxID=79912 RepID=A0ABN0X9N5_9ACTN|nr:DUF4232 domain-containing protein [Actinoallomurus spadix]MCO5987945.1 DUF4232 domain-containing protein [Actinoallomurus spadix]